MKNTPPLSALSVAQSIFPTSHRRPLKAYHLRFLEPVDWTLARDTQNAIIKAYQEHHHKIPRRPLPPTFITLRFNPVFTYGRSRDERPSRQDRRMLEGLPEIDGVSAETRMAWSRESGWRFHGPGQVHCWMVADLQDWQWEGSDVKSMMDSTLVSIIEHYLPHEVQDYSRPGLVRRRLSITPETQLFNELASTDIHLNKYRIISYGCCLNVRKDQVVWARRLTRYGIDNPEITSLENEGWTSEPTRFVQSRFVAELSQRIGVLPESVDTTFLARKLKAQIPIKDKARDRRKSGTPKNEEEVLNEVRKAGSQEPIPLVLKEKPEPFRFEAASLRKTDLKGDETIVVPSWGQYVRRAWLERQSHGLMSTIQTIKPFSQPQVERAVETQPAETEAVCDDVELAEGRTAMPSENGAIYADTSKMLVAEESAYTSRVTADTLSTRSEVDIDEDVGEAKPPLKVLEQTIQWSSADFSFVPPFFPERRRVVSAREMQDHEYLGDPPSADDIHVPPTGFDNNNMVNGNGRVLLEQRKRLIQKMRARGEDRI